MYQLIQRKGSSRHLMALLYTDGSVAKAWPFESADDCGKPIFANGHEQIVGNPMYGPLQIGKAESVNLLFGSFGISAWPSDTGGTSHTGSNDDSRADCTDTGSRDFSSCCSSPRMSEAASKELKKELSVSGSEEADDHQPDINSDDDTSDVDKKVINDEMEGSVNEGSTKSDEEYDLAMRDGHDFCYWSVDEAAAGPDEKLREKFSPEKSWEAGEKYQKNLVLFLKLSEQFPGSLCSLPFNSKTQMPNKQRSLSTSAVPFKL